MASAKYRILHLDGLAQAELVRKKEITPSELIDLSIGAIEEINPTLNAVITPMFESARVAAAGQLTDGSFRGVPFLLKDHLASFAGVRQTNGSRLFFGNVPVYDTELVRRYKQAGLITVGKTNLSEFAILPTTEPQAFGPTPNPWNLGHSAGGSRRGSAAAVAARLVPLAYGNDVGGSIRIPASCCGLFGLKPTRGRIPAGPQFTELLGGLVGEHVLTRSVRDSAAALDATIGPEPGDPYSVPSPNSSFLELTHRPLRKLRIGFAAVSPLENPVHPDSSVALLEAVKLCEELGHDVVESPLPLSMDVESFTRAYVTVLTVASSLSMAAFERASGHRVTASQVEPLSFALLEHARSISAPEHELARMALQRVSRGVGELFERIDVWLSPTLTGPPLPLGSFSDFSGNPLDLVERVLNYVAFAMVFNLTGQPAASIPLHWNRQNLPIGIQAVGRVGDEATLFQLAAQLEAVRPWTQRLPPVCA